MPFCSGHRGRKAAGTYHNDPGGDCAVHCLQVVDHKPAQLAVSLFLQSLQGCHQHHVINPASATAMHNSHSAKTTEYLQVAM